MRKCKNGHETLKIVNKKIGIRNIIIRSKNKEQKVDDDSKKHKCTYCEASFVKLKHLTRHLRKHTGEKFKCTQCDKEYSRKEHLRRHTLRYFISVFFEM